MVDNLNKAKSELSPETLSKDFNEETVDLNNPEIKTGILLGSAIYLLSCRYMIEKPESEATQNLLSRLYKFFCDNKDVFGVEFASEHEFAESLPELWEEDDTLSSGIYETSGEKGMDFLKKAVNIYIIRTEDLLSDDQ